MQTSDPHLPIARKIQSIESAKIAMVEQVAQVLRSIQNGSERDISQSLGELVGIAYFLGQQMDVPLETMERFAIGDVPRTLAQSDANVAAFSVVQRYLSSRR